MDQYRELVDAAHRAGIRVLLEWAATNTSIFSEWFLESRSSRSNPRADWYLWSDDVPNNWVSYSGGSSWHYCPERNQYYLGIFFKEHAELNWRNAEVRRAVLDAFEFWVKTGIDGFRIDTIDMYVKDAAFRDNPPKAIDPGVFLDPSDPILGSKYARWLIPEHLQFEHVHDRGQPETLDIMREMRAICDRYGDDLLLIGEVDIQAAAGRQLCESGMSVAFNFSLAYAPWSAPSFRRALEGEARELNDFMCCNTFSNHDVRRAISRFSVGDYAEDLKRAKVLAAITATLPGVPMIYYGEEIGMPDVELSYYELKDPISKSCWHMGALRETGRGPMQWGGEVNSGFSSGKPWMKMSTTRDTITVERQIADPDSMLNYYKRLVALRNSSRILQYGDFALVGDEDDEVLAYRRSLAGETMTVLLNFTDRNVSVDASAYSIAPKHTDVVMHQYGEGRRIGNKFDLLPYDVVMLKTEWK
jgi:alpha-glucosidase